MPSAAFHIAIILTPFLVLPLAGWLGGRRFAPALLAAIPAALTAYFTFIFSVISQQGPFSVAADWAPGLNLSLSFRLDGLGTIFALLITAIGTLIVVYAGKYLEHHPDLGKFYVALFAFMGSMLGLVLADDIVLLFVFWELTGFTSYLLIGFEHGRPVARRAATQALIVTGGGGLALLAAGILMINAGGTSRLSDLAAAGGLAGHELYTGIIALILLAAFTKSAQVPFHFWLPNAMEAPTPVSAYLHSATMVKAGVYLVARMTPVVGGTSTWINLITLFAALTMVVGAIRALLETDLKRILAYSTISALGILMLLFGAGTPEAVVAGLSYLIAHACYKGALFLVAGAIDHETGTRDVTALSGLHKVMPRTAAAAAVAAASMAGIPLLLGFIAKERFYESLMHSALPGIWTGVLVLLAVAASACLGATGFIAGIAPFRGPSMISPAQHEAPVSMWIGPAVLGAVSVILGTVPALAAGPIGLAAESVTRLRPEAPLALWHGFSPALLLSALTLAATVGLFTYRERFWQHRWPDILQAEHLYTKTICLLDAVSDRIAPLLQSASLRSYALVVVVSAIALVTYALSANQSFPEQRRWTPVEYHEAVLGVLIIGGALSAALARSNMAAVLSLGTVGYSIAAFYALLGAPDLAMTQFAVETLTVVIFVLVFYRLRGFADLSTRLVKTRDAVVAAAIGGLVALLVLYVGASGTTSRLAGYFAETAPGPGHGLNIVNVLLVDFRGFDTLGEITVLVSVAIGVRALLLIGRERVR